MQTKKTIWNVKKALPQDKIRISEALGCSGFIAELLCARGITGPETAKEMLFDSESGLWDPFLLKDMEKAAALLKDALQEGKRIAVFGDYDADGVSATAIIFSYLRSKNADCFFIIPDRFRDGYGLKDYFIRDLNEKGAEVIITVDCGISDRDKIKQIAHVHPSNTTRTLDYLENLGYIIKKISEQDKRICELYPTDKLKEAYDVLMKAEKEWIDIITKGMNNEELEVFTKCLEVSTTNSIECIHKKED
jgi:single-stranded-DNA-specific exonuclease